MRGHVLVVDDEPQMLVALDAALRRSGFQVTTAANGHEALARVEEQQFAVIFTDLRMPHIDGLELLSKMKHRCADVPIVLMTGYGSIPSAVQAIQQGAADYLVKPFDTSALNAVLARVVRETEEDPGDFLTASSRLKHVLSVARRAATGSSTILIEGESGTGKEVLARLIHRSSPRASRAFVAVNCAAIPETLLESELFGHERGAFTGANVRREGKFEVASGGTLLLDEIGEMPLALQAKLLRVLQERTVDRVGGRDPVPVDLRVVATTNVELARAVTEGDFRRDLYYRLKVVQLRLPPLRERPEDIALLAKRFVTALGGGGRSLSLAAAQRLEAHSWAGNVRELKNVIECAMTLSSAREIQPEDLFLDAPGASVGNGASSGTVADMEQELILKTLAETRGNRTKAAQRLGISIRTLRNKLALYRRQGDFVHSPEGRESEP
jgi:DNA-binding NtrC family response regulator